MPKMKTNRGAAKRFKLKKNLVKRGSAFKSHILTKNALEKLQILMRQNMCMMLILSLLKKCSVWHRLEVSYI